MTVPSPLVDRIAPATTDTDRLEVAAVLGMADAGAVRGKAFRHWVIEDDFRGDRPPWEAAVARIARDAAAHDTVKMRVHDAAQTMLAVLAVLREHGFTHEAVADAGLVGFGIATLRDETLRHLPPAQGMAHAP